MREKVTLEDVIGIIKTPVIEGRFHDILSISKIKDTYTGKEYDWFDEEFYEVINNIDNENSQWRNLAEDYNISYDDLYGIMEGLLTYDLKRRFSFKEDSLYVDDEFFCLLEDGEEITQLLNKQQDKIEYLHKLLKEE